MTKTEEIMKLCEAATPGQWKSEETEIWSPTDCENHQVADVFYGSGCRLKVDAENTAKFIAAANPATVRQMVELMRQMAEALKESNEYLPVGVGISALAALDKFERGE